MNVIIIALKLIKTDFFYKKEKKYFSFCNAGHFSFLFSITEFTELFWAINMYF